MISVTFTPVQLETLQHKLTVVWETEDLRESCGLTEEEAQDLRDRVPDPKKGAVDLPRLPRTRILDTATDHRRNLNEKHTSFY